MLVAGLSPCWCHACQAVSSKPVCAGEGRVSVCRTRRVLQGVSQLLHTLRHVVHTKMLDGCVPLPLVHTDGMRPLLAQLCAAALSVDFVLTAAATPCPNHRPCGPAKPTSKLLHVQPGHGERCPSWR